MGNYNQVDKAYIYLNSINSFTKEDLAYNTGWTQTNTDTNLSKKLKDFLKYNNKNKTYSIKDVFKTYNKDQFRKVFSQTYKIPKEEPSNQKLQKAKESILTAVQIYNNPTIQFKSGAFIPLLFIGYTSLFHATFERDNIEYIEKGKRTTQNGECYLYDITKCIQVYRNKYSKKHKEQFFKGLKTNIEYLKPIRDSIEHRYCPLIDHELYSSCQRGLLNFEEVLIKEFGIQNSLNTSLAMSLNFSQKLNKENIDAIKQHSSENYGFLKGVIKEQAAKLSEEELNNPYAFFNIYILPKKVNKENQADCIEYIHLENLKDIENIEQKIIGFIPDKDRKKGSAICAEIEPTIKSIYNIPDMKFNAGVHLSKLAKAFKWNNDGNYNNEYMGKDDLSDTTYYRSKATEYIKEQITNKPLETLKKFASKLNIEKYEKN